MLAAVTFPASMPQPSRSLITVLADSANLVLLIGRRDRGFARLVGVYSQRDPFTPTPECEYVVRPVPAENGSARYVCYLYERTADRREKALDVFDMPVLHGFHEAHAVWLFCAGHLLAAGYEAINRSFKLDWPEAGEVNFASPASGE